MAIGLIGKKCGMTRIFTESGRSIPVTVVQLSTPRVSQIKTLENDGYSAIQVATGEQRTHRLNKPRIGHLKKAGIESCRKLQEFIVDADQCESFNLGDSVSCDEFTEGKKINVQGITRGKGFAGGVKRHGFSMQDATHGNSLSHRAHGSVGQCQGPGRVFKGKKMAGQMGNVKRTIRNLEIVRIDSENGILLIKGGVPGSPNGDLLITLANRQPKGVA